MTTANWRKNLVWFGIVLGQSALVYALVFNKSSNYVFNFSSNGPVLGVVDPAQLQQLRGYGPQQQHQQQQLDLGSSSNNAVWAHNPLAIPPGQPPNLPRIEVRVNNHNDQERGKAAAGAAPEVDADADARRGIYGGRGDGKHLGGFTEFDPHGVSPAFGPR
jgi:hypothetical protein